MQQVSDDYRAQQLLPIAGSVQMRITFGLVDPTAAGDAAVTAQGEVYTTPATITYEGAVPLQVYATLEPGRMLADGRQLVLPHDPAARQNEGFVSAQLSDGEGAFAVPPSVEVAFAELHTVPALSFVFDRATGDHPSLVRVQAWRGLEPLCDEQLSPTSADYTADLSIERFDRLNITLLTTAKPHRRARIQQLVFGMTMVFGSDIIQSANQRSEVDPITRRLPQSTLQFSLVNTNMLTASTAGLYDPDNPSGVWRHMEQRNPIKAEYGQQLADGSIEWVTAGRYYLNAAPTVSGLYAKFTAIDLMERLGGSYRGGVWDGEPHSLLSLATAVLLDAELPYTAPDNPPWRLWSGLDSITTTAPLPVKKHKELLQLIAHAACCVIYCDREGYLNICPAPTASYPLHIGLDSMMGRPKASKIPTLGRVDCPAYSYAAEALPRELHKGNYLLAGERHLRIDYAMAVVDSVTATGGTVVADKLSAQSAELTLSGTGAVSVTVTGRSLAASQMMVSALVTASDGSGAVEQLDNPLITDAETASRVAQWVRDYLACRTSYEFVSRGNPECDPLDIIAMQSSFEDSFAAVVLRSETTFDGSLTGKMTCKRIVGSSYGEV